MQKEPTLKDIQNSIAALSGEIHSVKVSLEKRIDSVKVSLEKRIDSVKESLEERIDDLHEAMDLHSTEMDRQFRESRTNAATKSYVDDRIGQLRGEFVSMIKRNGHRTSAV